MHPDRRPWTRQELETLEKSLGKISAGTIAKRLKRTETSVLMNSGALGHSRRVTEGYKISDLEVCFGEDRHKIKKWLRLVGFSMVFKANADPTAAVM